MLLLFVYLLLVKLALFRFAGLGLFGDCLWVFICLCCVGCFVVGFDLCAGCFVVCVYVLVVYCWLWWCTFGVLVCWFAVCLDCLSVFKCLVIYFGLDLIVLFVLIAVSACVRFVYFRLLLADTKLGLLGWIILGVYLLCGRVCYFGCGHLFGFCGFAF